MDIQEKVILAINKMHGDTFAENRRELAAYINVSVRTVEGWEQGRKAGPIVSRILDMVIEGK